MNVLLVCAWDNLGGVCSVVNQVAKHLRSQGHRVYMLHPGDTIWPVEGVSRQGFPTLKVNLRPTSREGGTIRSRLAFALYLPFTLFSLAYLLVRRRIDVVNIHYPTSPRIYFAILRRLGFSKLVTSIHGADLLPNGVRLKTHQIGLTSVLRSSDLLVTPSDSFKRFASDAWPEMRDKWIETVPNGVDPTELGYYRSRGDTTVDPPYVLSILQLVHYKGVDILIRAFAELAPHYPQLTLKLISGGPNQREFAELATSLGVGGRVEFLGFLEKTAVATYLRGCLFFVLPSRTNSESFGIAAAEAMAVGRAVIASRIGGLPELVQDDVTGLLVPPGDVPALSAAMRRLLDNPHLRVQFGEAGGERVRQDFPWARTSAYYEALLLKACNKPIPPSRQADPYIQRISGAFPTATRENAPRSNVRS